MNKHIDRLYTILDTIASTPEQWQKGLDAYLSNTGDKACYDALDAAASTPEQWQKGYYLMMAAGLIKTSPLHITARLQKEMRNVHHWSHSRAVLAAFIAMGVIAAFVIVPVLVLNTASLWAAHLGAAVGIILGALVSIAVLALCVGIMWWIIESKRRNTGYYSLANVADENDS